MDLYTMWVVDITHHRLDEELRMAETHWRLRQAMVQGRSVTHLTVAWLGDRLIQAGQRLKQRYELEGDSAVSPWRAAEKSA